MPANLKKPDGESKKLNEEFKLLDEAKTEFIVLASHKLKSPLVTIMGYVEFLLAGRLGPINEKQKEKMQIVLANSQKLRNRIDKLLDLSDITLKRVELSLQKANISDIANEVAAEFKALAGENNALISLNAPEKIIINCDKGRIKQVLANLIENAVTYGCKDRKNKVEINVAETKKDVIIKVKDMGKGIPQDKLRTLFDPFNPVATAESSKKAGIGVGLTIVKKLVELHKGKIEVKSKPGSGSEFTITIPKS